MATFKFCNNLRLTLAMAKGAQETSRMNAAQRVSARIKVRLEELGMTGREFAKKLDGHKDAWISNLLANKFALSLHELDKAAEVLHVAPGDLVRQADEAYDLAPTERRVVRGLRLLPLPLRDQMVVLVEYLIGVAPEADTVSPGERAVIDRFRRLSARDRQLVELSIDRFLLLPDDGHTPGAATDLPGDRKPPAEPVPHTRKRPKA